MTLLWINKINFTNSQMLLGPEGKPIVRDDVFMAAEDARQALLIVEPSAMREVLVEVPNVSRL